MTSTLAELSEKAQAVSARYARVCDIVQDRDWYLLKLQEELGELTAEALRLTGRGRRAGVTVTETRVALADEAADLLGALLLFAHHHGIDLEAALERKWFCHLPESTARPGNVA